VVPKYFKCATFLIDLLAIFISCYCPEYYGRDINIYIFKFLNFCCGTLGTAATTGLLYQPWMISDGDCGETGGMNIGRGNRSTRRKPAPAPLCSPQIPHG
jgi:hypothetical protein